MLPIDPILPEIAQTLRQSGQLVLQAPPGAGKTTRVPLALMDQIDGKILMLEPRRIATRAAAQRLAEQLGEDLGGQVGYRMRGASAAGRKIEVITEGILTRMIQSDPELPGIGAVIFDEFHERALAADLGLALVLEIRAALRPDLAVMVMSATLDAAPVAALMGDAPLLTSEGRSFPVHEHYLDRPRRAGADLIRDMADLVREAWHHSTGGMLVFLPGEGEIRRLHRALEGLKGAQIQPLFGALPFADQQRALRPVERGRKLVLATSIAETSLTIPDIRVVVDSGLARRARFDPGSGMSRLVTEKASRAEVTQRAGRAGRVAEGECYRLWSRAETGALPGFSPPEIARADLTDLALELALWGTQDLPFLTPPPEGSLAEAQALLRDLGCLDARGGITDHGRAVAALPLHPRLGHMMLRAGAAAAPLAAILSDRVRGMGMDLAQGIRALRGEASLARIDPGARKRVQAEAKRLARLVPGAGDADLPQDPGLWAALAYPDRIGKRRAGDAPRWLLSGGRGAQMEPGDALASAPILVATDLDGAGREARIRQAIRLDEGDLRAGFADQITWQDHCTWSRRDRAVVAQRREMLGAVVLDQRRWDAPDEALAEAMLDGVRELGLPRSKAADRLRDRVALCRAAGHELPDMSDAALLASAEAWLLPYLSGITTAAAWARFDLAPALRAMLDWDQTQVLDRETPSKYTTALGRQIPVDYTDDGPVITIRIQEMFGVTRHPMIGGKPAKLVLLSPAQRPIQITMDLPGFWASSYADLRKDMRGEYPKHPWPEDPTEAEPTLRAKRRPAK